MQNRAFFTDSERFWRKFRIFAGMIEEIEIIKHRIQKLEEQVEDARTDRAVVILSIALILHIVATWLL